MNTTAEYEKSPCPSDEQKQTALAGVKAQIDNWIEVHLSGSGLYSFFEITMPFSYYMIVVIDYYPNGTFHVFTKSSDCEYHTETNPHDEISDKDFLAFHGKYKNVYSACDAAMKVIEEHVNCL